MSVLTDIHTHTYPSSHDGQNTLREMLAAAIEKNISYYGISNHFDYDYDERLMTEEEKQKLANGDEEEYFSEARIVQKEYEKDIKLLVGAEFGYSTNPEIQKQYLDTYQKYQIDYVINSVHSNNGRDFSRSVISNDKQEAFGLYLRLVRQSLDAPYPYDVIGHFEYIARYVPFAEKRIKVADFQLQLDDILKAIIERGKILEANTSICGLDRISLPDREIFARYYQLGGRKVTFGSDAHTITRLLDGREQVVAMFKEIGFTYITIPFRGECIQIPI